MFQPTFLPVDTASKNEINRIIKSIEGTEAYNDAKEFEGNLKDDRCCDAAQTRVDLKKRHVGAMFLLAVRGEDREEEIGKELMGEVEALRLILDCVKCSDDGCEKCT